MEGGKGEGFTWPSSKEFVGVVIIIPVAACCLRTWNMVEGSMLLRKLRFVKLDGGSVYSLMDLC